VKTALRACNKSGHHAVVPVAVNRLGRRTWMHVAGPALALACVAGCSIVPRGAHTPPAFELMPDVNVSATVELARSAVDVLRARVRVVSRRRDAVQFETANDWCALTVRAYADDRPSGPAVWSSDQPRPGEPPSACIHVIRAVTLMPGDVEVFEASFPTSHILGANLHEGRYHFTVALKVYRPPITTPELRAGSVVLRR
jgi:hypothetical protein